MTPVSRLRARMALGTLVTLALLLLPPDVHAARKPPAERPAKTEKQTKKATPPAAKSEKAPAKPAPDMRLALFDVEALRRAIDDLAQQFPLQYTHGKEYLRRLDEYAPRLPEIQRGLAAHEPQAIAKADELLAFQREALLANPLLDFERLLLVRRGIEEPAPAGKDADKADKKARAQRKSPSRMLGLPQNWQGNCSLPKNGYNNAIETLSLHGSGQLTPLFRPEQGRFVGDVRLHFDAERLLFSMPSEAGPWQVFEVRVDGSGLTQVTPAEPGEVDNYDACYLPDERIIYSSTANLQGVPCVGGSAHVANLAIVDRSTQKARMLTFEQDHDWCPTLLPTGRVMYTRWEYTDTAHYFTRLLFSMNPDGTGQMEHYGSNSYWPNSLFYCRPTPGNPTRFVGIVSGHHGVPRMGELVLFDAARGRHEASGVVQRIPGWGKKVEPQVVDQLVNASWPKFLHPWPLSDKYFLVACQPSATALWGIYLADVFDNLVLIKEMPGNALFEPVPLRKTARPPVVPDKVDLARDDATIYLVDVYRGPGLSGIPRGTVKQLRVFSYEYCYQGVGGHDRLGVESSWDVKRVLGTVPVEADGSALFRVPANTPISVQPLDEQGRALQLMRSWFTAMPGETLSCVGCHDSQNTTTPGHKTLAAARAPSSIAAWYGPPRGFGFLREVQPVLDAYCTSCHNGQPQPGRPALSNLADTKQTPVNAGKRALQFPQSYMALHPYVSRPGPESDYHILSPMDFHASASALVQMLRKGHHGVTLDDEAWSRITTWIDLNAPCYGSWREAYADNAQACAAIEKKCTERQKNVALLAGVKLDPKMEQPATLPPAKKPIAPASEQPAAKAPRVPNWPFDAEAARKLQAAAGKSTTRSLDLGEGVALALTLIPAGQFAMGDAQASPAERPLARVAIQKPFWMGVCEITNAQYARFDPTHTSGYIDQQGKDHNTPGYSAMDPQQPVIRVSWQQALEFCRWLSQRSGARVLLPTEAQWEWACRAGSERPFWYGEYDTDFAPYANLGDAMLRNFAVRGVNPQPLKEASYLAFLPRLERVNDGQMIAGPVGSYAANPWGLRDMHGSVAEWTRTTYRPYPYDPADGRDDPATAGEKVVRGGSWRDRPERASAAFRLPYQPYQRLFTVGFRVVVELDAARSVKPGGELTLRQ